MVAIRSSNSSASNGTGLPCQRQRLPRCRSPCPRRTNPARARSACQSASQSSAARFGLLPFAHPRGRQSGMQRRSRVAGGDVAHRPGNIDISNRAARVIRGNRVGQRVQQRRIEPPGRGDRIKEITRRYPRHAQHPIQGLPRRREVLKSRFPLWKGVGGGGGRRRITTQFIPKSATSHPCPGRPATTSRYSPGAAGPFSANSRSAK